MDEPRDEPLSVTPTWYGFTPIGMMIVAAAAMLIAGGLTRAGLCEYRATAADQCAEAWSSFHADLRTSGLGIGGLLAQSPLSALMNLADQRRKDQRRAARSRRWFRIR
jgi:hypothetical protein